MNRGALINLISKALTMLGVRDASAEVRLASLAGHGPESSGFGQLCFLKLSFGFGTGWVSWVSSDDRLSRSWLWLGYGLK